MCPKRAEDAHDWQPLQASGWRRDLLINLPPSTASSEITGARYAQCRIDGAAPQDYYRSCPAQIALRVEGGLHATSLTARSAPYGRPLIGAPAFAQPPVTTTTTTNTVKACHRDLRRRHPDLHREPERAQDQIMLTYNAVEHITDFGDAASTRPTPRRARLWPCQQTRARQVSRGKLTVWDRVTAPNKVVNGTATLWCTAPGRTAPASTQLPRHRALQHHADLRGVLLHPLPRLN